MHVFSKSGCTLVCGNSLNVCNNVELQPGVHAPIYCVVESCSQEVETLSQSPTHLCRSRSSKQLTSDLLKPPKTTHCNWVGRKIITVLNYYAWLPR